MPYPCHSLNQSSGRNMIKPGSYPDNLEPLGHKEIMVEHRSA